MDIAGKDLVLAAAVAPHLPKGWWAERDAYMDKQAHNRQRANVLAVICDVSTEDVLSWQVDSGLSFDDFWQLANVLNVTGWRYLEDLAGHITQAAVKINPSGRKPRKHPVRRLKKRKRA